jgi:hypothetical protein
MDNKQEKDNERMFHKNGINFKKFEEMAEMMRSCCTGERGMMDCCSMMRKMMEEGKEKETVEKSKDADKTK